MRRTILLPLGLLSLLSLLGFVVGACGFPRPPDVGDDDVDPPRVIVQVAGTGDDANDGFTRPVKTLKHAIGIAALNRDVTDIVLASGRYTTAGGETFPYTVPDGVTVSGPVGGGAIIGGSKAEPGMIVDTGTLRDLELEDFTVAVTATGDATLAGLRIRTNMVAIRAETSAKLTADNVDITGAVGACATGIVLNGAAKLEATGLASRNLGMALQSKDQSVADLDGATITGDRNCSQGVLTVSSNRTFTLTNSILDSGNNGLYLYPTVSTLHVSVTNTLLRNFKNDAIQGGNNSGGSLVFEMAGGELSGNPAGAELSEGIWSFTNVTFRQNAAYGVYANHATLTMRGCQLSNNGTGVSLDQPIAVDLGTATTPGNNTLQNNEFLGLHYTAGTIQVDAIGNTWNRRIQDASDLGLYPNVQVIDGPTVYMQGNNYMLTCDRSCSLRR